MWLLHSRELRLEAYSDASIPLYAILSHRWGTDEVTFQELQAAIAIHTSVEDEHTTDHDEDANRLARPLIDFTDERYSKIQKTRELARTQLIQWVWIDTCCIDKKSSAELSEAINSMFRWYARAEICYAYLSDVTQRPCETRQNEESCCVGDDEVGNLQNSCWFNRGWTLQELLAPKRVFFFDREWTHIGERDSVSKEISRKTGIERRFLEDRRSLNEASIAKKMSWASIRQTTREEDMAYCLLGLFDVNMPLLYGEGPKAFMRLQLEIIRKSDDESIFAWRRADAKVDWERQQKIDFNYEANERRFTIDKYMPGRFQLHSGLLAQEPLDFAKSGMVKWTRRLKFARRLPYDMTNQGLRFYVDAYPSELQRLTHVGDPFDAVLNCYQTMEERGVAGRRIRRDEPVVITLMKEIAGYDQYWRRQDCTNFQGPFTLRAGPREEKVQTAFYIRQDGL